MSKAKLKISKVQKKLHSNTMLNKPVTIVILTWNTIQATIGLIDSLFEKPLPLNANLLFIDNGSHDYTVDYLMRYDDLELIINPKNFGYTRAANQGIQSVDTDIILLNNDTGILQQNWIQLLQETAYSQSSVGPVGCRLINEEGKIVHAGGWVNPDTCTGGNVSCELNQRTTPTVTSYVTFGCVYLKRDLINKCGLMHEGYFAYYEDLDYCLLAQEQGYTSVMDGRVNILHLESASSRFNKDEINIEIIKVHSELLFGTRWRHKIHLMNCPEAWKVDSYPGRSPQEIKSILGIR